MLHFVTLAMSLLRKNFFISMDNCKHSGNQVLVNHFAILPNAPSEVFLKNCFKSLEISGKVSAAGSVLDYSHFG